MLVNLPENVAALRTGIGALTGGYRAKMRSRTYRTAELNCAPDAEVVSVTTTDGARLRVHAYGPADGDVIVFVHGWSCCLEYWNPQINSFARDHRVIAFDQRGHGDSTLGTGRFDAEQLADDLCAVLTRLCRRDVRPSWWDTAWAASRFRPGPNSIRSRWRSARARPCC